MSTGTLHTLVEAWTAWAVGALADGALALLAGGVLWFLFRRIIPARWGMWLFLLVMAKSLIPTPVAMPGWSPGMLEGKITAGAAPHESIAGAIVPGAEAGGAAHAGAELPAAPARPAGEGTVWLFLIWCLAVACGLSLLGLRAWRTWRLVRNARPLAVGELEPDAEWAARLDLREIALRESDELSSPAAWGGRKPCVILPSGLAEKLSVPQLRWTLAHEISHLRHGDWAVALAQSLCGLLCFFNPVVWIASIAASALRERACDEAAVRITGIPPKESAGGFLCLLEWAQARVSFRGAVMPGLSLEGRTARWRLRRLLQGITPLRQSSVMTAAVLLAALLLLPSFRSGLLTGMPAEMEVLRLRAQVVDLEDRLRKKSGREERVELNQRRASERAARDADVYTHEQLGAIETIYQEARKKLSAAEKEEAYATLAARYPLANRTGCAMLFSARAGEGAVRERKLREVIASWSDCHYLDGTSVGGVARLVLARDLIAAGRKGEAVILLDELERDFTGCIDHEGNPIEDGVAELRAGL